MDSRDDIVERIPVKRGRPPKPKLKVEKILIKEEDYQYDSEENDTKFIKCVPLPENEREDSVKSNSNSSRSVTIHPSLGQLGNLSEEESEDEEIMSVLGTRGTSSKPSISSVNRRGSVASRTRMPSVGKRRSKRLKKPATTKTDSNKKTIHNQASKRGRPQKCVVSLEKLSAPRLPSVVGQGVEINVDSESEASSDAGSYTHSYNKRRLYRSSPSSSKGSGGDDGDSEDNGSYVELKTERDESDIDGTSDIDESLGGKRVRAAAAAAMELVTKKRMEAISDRDRERAERRNRKPYIKPFVPKGRSRRTIVFKRGSLKPTRGVDSIPYLTFMSSIVYKGVYFQEGDIVYILGQDERPYYCQIRHIARDWNYEAICGLFWLTPKKGTKGPFNPINFDIRDDFPVHNRKFEYVNFVMHCPMDYWYGRESSYLHPLPGTVYQRLGEPLVEVVKLPPKKLGPVAELELVKEEKVSEDSPIKIETETCGERDSKPEGLWDSKPEGLWGSKPEERALSDYNEDENDENMPPECENIEIDYTEEEAVLSHDEESDTENVYLEDADEEVEMGDEIYENNEVEETENVDLEPEEEENLNQETEEEEMENVAQEPEEEEIEDVAQDTEEEECENAAHEEEEEECENVTYEEEEEECENVTYEEEEEECENVAHEEEEECENVAHEEEEEAENVAHEEEEETENLAQETEEEEAENVAQETEEEEAENVAQATEEEEIENAAQATEDEEAESVSQETEDEEIENIDQEPEEETENFETGNTEDETEDDVMIIEQESVEMEIEEVVIDDPVTIDCVEIDTTNDESSQSSDVELLEQVQTI